MEPDGSLRGISAPVPVGVEKSFDFPRLVAAGLPLLDQPTAELHDQPAHLRDLIRLGWTCVDGAYAWHRGRSGEEDARLPFIVPTAKAEMADLHRAAASGTAGVLLGCQAGIATGRDPVLATLVTTQPAASVGDCAIGSPSPVGGVPRPPRVPKWVMVPAELGATVRAPWAAV
jgi:hypothetical protein